MKRRCEESVPLLGPYLDGELPEEDLVWLEEHLDDCDTCTAPVSVALATRRPLPAASPGPKLGLNDAPLRWGAGRRGKRPCARAGCCSRSAGR